MLEMQGFNHQAKEAYWLRQITANNVKTPLDLFLLSYDIMRLHYRSVVSITTDKLQLKLSPDQDLELFHTDYSQSDTDDIGILAHRGLLIEEIALPRDKLNQIIVEPMLIIKDYTSLLFQRELDEEPEAYIEPSEADIKNASVTIWRAHLTTI